MNENSSLRVIGAETAAESNMIIVGTEDEIETASTIATEITIGTTSTITTANRRRIPMCKSGYVPLGITFEQGTRLESRVIANTYI